LTRLPSLTPRQAVAALKRAGFVEDVQRGSHLLLRHPLRNLKTVVAMHSGDLPRSILKKIVKQAGLTEEEFRRLI
jgi:predicted RNA binding protein YcfA (HicA-like mRNA interferase family)